MHALAVLLCLPVMGQSAEPEAPEVSLLAIGPHAGVLTLGAGRERLDLGPLARTPVRHRARSGRAVTLGLATAALILTDQDTHDLIGTNGDGADADISQWVQTFGLESGAASVAGLYLLGDDYDKTTAKTAATAATSAALTVWTVKLLTGRERPSEPDGGGSFRGPFSGHQSFASGHTAIAFSLATVYGERYPRYEWAFDALAIGVGVARMREDEHFLSDVFVGAAAGKYFGHRALQGKGGLFGFRF